MPAVPETMQAAAIERFGKPAVLKLRELPVPVPGPGEVLIALHTAGVGSWDAWHRQGGDAPRRPRFPMVLGTDGHISEAYPLADAAKAHQRIEAGHVLGKIVLRIR
jgi:NADPH:quinone reductase-like Zn-dependent oxidoreductase